MHVTSRSFRVFCVYRCLVVTTLRRNPFCKQYTVDKWSFLLLAIELFRSTKEESERSVSDV